LESVFPCFLRLNGLGKPFLFLFFWAKMNRSEYVKRYEELESRWFKTRGIRREMDEIMCKLVLHDLELLVEDDDYREHD